MLKNGNLHKRVMTEYQQEGLFPIMLSLHNNLEEMNSSVLVEIRKFNESNVLNELNFSILEQVKTILSSRLISIERQCWLNTEFQTGMSRHNRYSW